MGNWKLIKENKNNRTQLIKLNKVVENNEVKNIDQTVECLKCHNLNDLVKFELAHKVCYSCKFHHKLNPTEWIELITNKKVEKSTELFTNIFSQNPIKFPGYSAKLKLVQGLTNESEAVKIFKSKMRGLDIVVAIMNPFFIMGSMGSVVGEKLTRAIEYATKNNIAILFVTASGGARMHEGLYSLMQMAKTSAALKVHSDKGLFSMTLFTNPTTGGVTASFASLTTVQIGEPFATIALSGKRVIKQILNEDFPDNFQEAEWVLKNGFLDMIICREFINSRIKTLLKLFVKGGNFYGKE